jgi:hypothetical protein
VDIFFAASNNNGTSFGTPINVSNNTGSSINPQLAAISSNVYVTWQDNTFVNNLILFAASNNNGSSFGPPIGLFDNSISPQIATSGNNVYVTVQDNTPGNNQILFAASNNNGSSFGPPINLSNNGGSAAQPRIATSGNNVFVTWRDSGNSDLPDIFVISNERPFGGFGTSINISNNLGFSTNPQIAVS